MPSFTGKIITASLGFGRDSTGAGRHDFLSFSAAAIGPLSAIGMLCLMAWWQEGQVAPHHLVLCAFVFLISTPGKNPLTASSHWMLVADVLANWVLLAAILALIGWLTGYTHRFRTQTLLDWLVLGPMLECGLGLALRLAMPVIFRVEGAKKRTLIVGMNQQGVTLAQQIRSDRFSRIEIVGFVDSRNLDRLSTDDRAQILGQVEELAQVIKQHRIQVIYLSLPMTSQPRILQILDELKDTTSSIYFVPDMFVTDLIQGHATTVCGVPVISVCETPFVGVNGAVKRISDLILASLILVLISPILLGTALAVRLSSPGPVIFRQRRYGLDGEEIIVYKFRSMRVTEDGTQVMQAVKGDPRVTRVGAFIRRTSLDELPQFVNVLQGRMSIVGPRPHAVAHNEMYRKLIKGYMVRHKVKPGITGLAQVSGYRGETETVEKMQRRIDFDLDYLRNWSLRLDLLIILKTVRLVASDQQAY